MNKENTSNNNDNTRKNIRQAQNTTAADVKSDGEKVESQSSHAGGEHPIHSGQSYRSSYSPDHLEFDPVIYQFKHRKKKDANLKKNEILRQKGMEGDLRPSKLKIFGGDYFLNYELSWLQFNWRVLHEATDKKNPLLERVKFIGIVCSNLDEFFQKRVGGLKRQLHAGVKELSVDGMTPMDQLKAIRKDVKKMINSYRDTFFNNIIPELEEAGIHFRSYRQLKPEQKRTIDDYFNRQLYPILTPLGVDEAHPFPFISNKSRSFAIELYNPDINEHFFARLKIPKNRPRWLVAEQTEERVILVNIDDVIKENVERLFPGMEVESANLFRVTRNADLERNEEEADDLLELIEDELRERRFAEIVRLEVESDTPIHIKEYLIKNMDIKWADVFEMDGPIGLADCMELYGLDGFPKYRYKKFTPTLHPVFRHEMDEEAPDIFSIIRDGDFMVHHPYHSFATSTQRFVEEAAKDPNVLAIKQTLYRTSSDSPLMHALMRAADQGKQVAVLVELKARFDEQRNITWAQKLEKAGVHVAYGIPGYKIHSKTTVVVREEEGKIRRYAHIGTGNYHPDTAQLYEDIGLFTSDEIVGSDVSDLFNLLTGFAPEQRYKKLVVAPRYMRTKFLTLIDYEIKEAKEGRQGRIIAKMNNLEDPLLIQRLYEASEAGVQIDLIVRSVCRIRPQIEGLSENIRVHSIIGRFLEHSRVFYFLHGGSDYYYLGSADWMHSNLDARLEAIVPVEQPQPKQYLQFVINVSLRDNKQRWVLDKNGKWEKVQRKGEEPEIATHPILMNHMLDLIDPVPSTVD